MKKRPDLLQFQQSLPSLEAQLALVAFAREGDVVKAAASLGVTQPALSFQLKRLAEQVGLPIFSISGKRKVLTSVGRELAKRTESSLTAWRDQIRQIEDQSKDLSQTSIRIAGRRELLLPMLGSEFPGKIEWVLTSSSDAVLGLKEHRFDLAVSAKTQDSGELVARPFFSSGLKWVYPRSWQKRGGGALSPQEFLSRPAIVYGHHYAYLKEVFETHEVSIQNLKVSRIVEDWFSVVEMVRYGLGWAVVPETWELHHPDVVEQAMAHAESLTQKTYIYFRRQDRGALWLQGLRLQGLKLESLK